MDDPRAIPPAVLKVARMLIASGLDLSDTTSQPEQQRTEPYRVSEVAAALDVHPSTVYREVEAGRLRALRIGHGRGAIRIPVDAFEEYKRKRTDAARNLNRGEPPCHLRLADCDPTPESDEDVAS